MLQVGADLGTNSFQQFSLFPSLKKRFEALPISAGSVGSSAWKPIACRTTGFPSVCREQVIKMGEMGPSSPIIR